MFEKVISFKLDNLAAFSDVCSSALKRIKYVDNNSFILFENTFSVFVFYLMSFEGKVLKKWEYEFDEDMLLDYIYVDGGLCLVFISQLSQYDESINFYCSTGNSFEWIASMPKECYQHDMDFFHMFSKNNKIRFLTIRHNRLHLYTIENSADSSSYTDSGCDTYTSDASQIVEISVLEGFKWVISNGYAVNIKGVFWELYDSNLELICSFEFTDELIDWLGISVSNDSSIIAIATDYSEGEKGALAIYDKNADQVNVHFQRYGFFSIGVADNKVWTTITSSFSDIGGIMIFDKDTNLKYALLKNEDSTDSIGAFNPSPIIYQASDIESLCDNKLLFISDKVVFITDVSCRNIQDLPVEPYECIDLSKDKSVLIIVSYKNRLYGGNPDQKYSAEVIIYKWDAKQIPASIVDLKSYIKN